MWVDFTNIFFTKLLHLTCKLIYNLINTQNTLLLLSNSFCLFISKKSTSCFLYSMILFIINAMHWKNIFNGCFFVLGWEWQSLCNACGIRYKKEERRANAAAAAASGGVMESQGMYGHHQDNYWYNQHSADSDNGMSSFLSWRLNVTDRPSLVHDFTR